MATIQRWTPATKTASPPKKTKAKKDIRLPRSWECVLDEGDSLRVDQYYHLGAANFSAIDSLFFIYPPGEPSPILLAFQIRHNTVCDVDKEDLRRVDGLTSPHANARKFFVAVAPDSIQPGIETRKTFFEGGRKRRKVRQQKPGKD